VQTTPQIRAVVAPPDQPNEASAYWEGRFDALRKTESWKKYIHDNQLEESFAPGPELKKTMVDIERQLKDAYTQAGIKTVR
jgi:tripartite-type tricarboxylate transporter receptor subunit TctC